ncbi:MAG: FHA domain-containing protein [Anaerolineae bacterium]|nr:FHA domain-containing protein [Thermoflexales bacterium]MDW8406610.1 FHA domain-containing protein [Anaerolineae bacterium]
MSTIILQFIHRTMGAMWVFAGALLVLASGLLAVAPDRLRQLAFGDVPQVGAVLQPMFMPSLAAVLAGVVSGIYMMVVGFGLVTLRSWARLISIALNVAVGACLAAFAAAIVMYIPAGGMSSSTLMIVATAGSSAAVLLAFSLALSAPIAIGSFGEAVPAVPRPAPAKCPTCAGALDLTRARCPKCDLEMEHPAEPKRARLVEVRSGREYPLSLRKLNRIGRESPDLDVSLDHRSVSANHASIEHYHGRFYLHAHNDAFGTCVNQRRVREAEIRHNDVLTFGQAECRFIVDY